ncbi:hypothetical protein V3C33_14135 [Micrococcaceae bacterium Sec5.7]
MLKDAHELYESEAPGQWVSPASCLASDMGPDYPVLHQQVLDIIDKVLADSAPEHSEVRRRLLQHLAENPGRPEQALLDHIRDRNNRRGRRTALEPGHQGSVTQLPPTSRHD